MRCELLNSTSLRQHFNTTSLFTASRFPFDVASSSLPYLLHHTSPARSIQTSPSSTSSSSRFSSSFSLSSHSSSNTRDNFCIRPGFSHRPLTSSITLLNPSPALLTFSSLASAATLADDGVNDFGAERGVGNCESDWTEVVKGQVERTLGMLVLGRSS